MFSKKNITIIIFGIITLVIVAVNFWFTGESEQETARQWNQQQQRLKDLDQQMSVLSKEIKKLAGKSKCESDYHCKVVGLGAKICDGYANFLIYSTFDVGVYESELLHLVEEFNQADQEYIAVSMKSEHCGEPALTPRCYHNRCTVR